MRLHDHVDRYTLPEPGKVVTYRGPRGDVQGRLAGWNAWGAKIEGHGWSAECLPIWAIRPATHNEISDFLRREWDLMTGGFPALEANHVAAM